MLTIRVVFSLMLVTIFTGCAASPQQSATSSTKPATIETIVDLKQPEPGTPVISGELSGLPAEIQVTIRIRTQTGNEIQWGNRKGSGIWETVISNARESEFYTVLAKAKGYKSTPESYKIFIKDKIAYVVEGDTITTTEARHLDFHFEAQE